MTACSVGASHPLRGIGLGAVGEYVQTISGCRHRRHRPRRLRAGRNPTRPERRRRHLHRRTRRHARRTFLRRLHRLPGRRHRPTPGTPEHPTGHARPDRGDLPATANRAVQRRRHILIRLTQGNVVEPTHTRNPSVRDAQPRAFPRRPYPVQVRHRRRKPIPALWHGIPVIEVDGSPGANGFKPSPVG